MATVAINGVGKRFGTLDVLPEVTLAIPDGAFVALVGPSGCGKSTLLRMIAGLEEVSWGQIVIGDRDVTDMAPKDRDIAMVFQNYALYPHMTVAQNMGFSLRINRLAKGDIAAQVARASGILGLDALLDRFPRQLSGGQRQRVAMGRAIVRNPVLFLFDEPLSNLDAKLRVQMRAEIKDLHQRLGTTTIYVTHDQVEAMTMADRIVVMNKGRVEQQGSPMDLYRRPGNLFVAGFIGSPAMNILPATVRSGSSVMLADGTELPIGASVRVTLGQPVQIGIRPEHLLLAPAGGLVGRVTMVEPTGPHTHLHVSLAGQDTIMVVDGGVSLDRASTVNITIAPEQIHVFDSAGGQRLNADLGPALP